MTTFVLKSDAKSEPLPEHFFKDFDSCLYRYCDVVKRNQGKILVKTEPTGGKVILKFLNGFIGAIRQAYNEHRHLVLRPDDIWLAITTALGLYVNNHSEEMRSTFVDHAGKLELVAEGDGDLYTLDWGIMIDQMSDLIEQKTKGDVRTWIEPNFSTTTPTIKTVGQVVLMGAMKKYFHYKWELMCGLPKVTLEGTLQDWKQLRLKASHLKNLNVECLTHWAGLLEIVLEQFEKSYEGKVNVDFWSHICHYKDWGSGPSYLLGWANVFIPFHAESGNYILQNADPEKHDWCRIDTDDIPPSTTEVPVLINDNGRKYATIFYGGHIVCVYNEADDTIRPSLDWAIVDVTEFLEQNGDATSARDSDCDFDSSDFSDSDSDSELRERKRFHKSYNWKSFPKPTTFKYGA